jgi:ABC-2 type transport system permease protein
MTTLRLHPRWPYLTLALTTLQRAVAYRVTFFFSLLSGLIWVIMLYYLWGAVYATREQVASLDWPLMRTYILVSYAVNSLLSWNSLSRMVSTVRTGEVATELLRPVDYLFANLAQASGAAVVEGGLSGLLALLVGIFVLDTLPPATPLAALLFLISVLLGFVIRFLLGYMLALLCFWTLNGVGLMWAFNAVVSLASGALIPLTLFPGWLRTVLLIAPFQAIVYTPVSIYLGSVQGMALIQALAVQVSWVLILYWLARRLWQPALRALEVQGG